MTDSEESLACSLAVDALESRKAAIRQRVLAHARSTREIAGGFELRFDATQALRDSLDEFIALESSCCNFLRFERSEGAPGDALTLTVTGPEAAQAMIRGFLGSGAADRR